jgi:hypothetical protein
VNRGIILSYNRHRQSGVVRDLGTGVRFRFEIKPPDPADLRVGDLVDFRPGGLPRAEQVALVGRFVPASIHVPIPMAGR